MYLVISEYLLTIMKKSYIFLIIALEVHLDSSHPVHMGVCADAARFFGNSCEP
jgi:hypothetical protein